MKKIKKEKDNKFEILMNNIIGILNVILDDNGQLTDTIDIIGSSKLFEYIAYKFKTISLVEISNNSTHYKLIFNLIQLYCFEPTISIFFAPVSRNSLYNSIKCLYKKAIKTLQFNDQNDYANTIINIYNMIRDAKKKKITNIKKYMDVKNIEKIDNMNSSYAKLLGKYKLMMGNLTEYTNYYYIDLARTQSNNIMKNCYKRISSELPSLIESLPINDTGSILVLLDQNKLNVLRFMIIGSTHTPYANGIFFFDVYLDYTYPMSAPKFRFINVIDDHKNFYDYTYNLGPNLYDSGKICLSLLDTYVGSAPNNSEKWNPRNSTLYLVIISIQGQILVEYPYFNQQGYEKTRNTTDGMRNAIMYNESIYCNTINLAMIKILKNINSYPEFKRAILIHFYKKQEQILFQCREWINNAKTHKKEMIKNSLNTLENLLMKIKILNDDIDIDIDIDIENNDLDDYLNDNINNDIDNDIEEVD